MDNDWGNYDDVDDVDDDDDDNDIDTVLLQIRLLMIIERLMMPLEGTKI